MRMGVIGLGPMGLKPIELYVEEMNLAMASHGRNLRVGVIGTGGMGTRHIMNLYRFISDVDAVALYDVDQARVRQVAAECSGAQVFDDPRKLIQADEVDAVLIASPDETHVALTLACLEAGKPTLCEKPLATTVEDAERVLQAEVALGRKLISVGFMRRFDPQHVAVKNIAGSGEIGAPLLFKGVHRNASVAFGTTGATVLINSAGHDLDSARWMLGEHVDQVYVRGFRSRVELHPDTQDLFLIILSFTDNRMATLEVYMNDDYGYEVSAEVVCQRGTAVTEQPDAVLVRAQGQRGYNVPNDWLARFNEAYINELRNWADSIQFGKPFLGANAWDGYVTMRVTDACIQSLRTGEIVPVEVPEKPALYV